MIGITKNYRDIEIYGFAIVNFKHTKNFHFLYIVSTACSTPTHFSHFQEKKYINLLLLSLYKKILKESLSSFPLGFQGMVIVLHYVYFIMFF